MNQDRLKLFIILAQGLGLLVTLICSFLGGIYIFSGQWLFAFPVSLLFVVAVYYLVIYFCKEKENRKKRGYPPAFYYLFGAYGIISLVLSVFVLHFYNVEVNEKANVQEIGLKKVAGLKLLYSEYDNNYTNFLTTAESSINNSVNQYINNVADRPNIEASLAARPLNVDHDNLASIIANTNRALAIKNQLAQRKLGFQQFKNQILGSNTDIFIETQSSIITNWDRFKLVNSLVDLNERLTEDYEKLNGNLVDKINNTYAITGFNPAVYKDESLINEPLALAAKHLGPMSLVVLLFFQFLILLPYFLTKGRIYGR
jgi:hypothetical protein